MNPDTLVFKGMKCNKKSNNKIRAHWTGYRRSMIKIRKVDGLLTRLYKNGRPARPSYHVILQFGTLTRTLRMMHLRYQSWPCRLVGVIVGVTFSLQESSFFENCHFWLWIRHDNLSMSYSEQIQNKVRVSKTDFQCDKFEIKFFWIFWILKFWSLNNRKWHRKLC